MDPPDPRMAHGFLHVPDVVPHDLIDRANQRIDEDLTQHYDVDRLEEYIHRSFCPRLRRHRAITDLLSRSPARAVVDRLLPYRLLFGAGTAQIVIRDAHEVSEPVVPDWHIDGVPTRLNEMVGGRLGVFTALVGVFLTPCEQDDAGNFTVFPSSHERLRRWFVDQGRVGLAAGRPDIDPGPPHQLHVRPGDVVVANYLLAHAATPNASSVQRRAVFFRLALPKAALRPFHCVTHPWAGWRTPPRAPR